MHCRFKLTLIAAAVAIAGGAGSAIAAPGNAGSAAPKLSDTRLNDGITTVYHRRWHHGPRYNYRPHYRHYRPYRHYRHYRPYYRPYRYHYRPRCYWSRYYHRTICR